MMLEREGFDVAPAASAAEAKRILGEVDVAAMILDLALPDQDGISLIHELRENPATADLPIVVVSAKAKEGKRSLNGDAFGVVDWLEKPVDPKRLFSAIRRALGLVSGHKPRVLHVEDDADVLDVVRAVTGDDAVIVPAGSVSEARRRLRSEVFDLVVLDLMLPDGSGVELLTDLRGPDGAPLPVVIFSVKEVSSDVAARVSATLVKSRTSIEELVATIRKLVTSARGASARSRRYRPRRGPGIWSSSRVSRACPERSPVWRRYRRRSGPDRGGTGAGTWPRRDAPDRRPG